MVEIRQLLRMFVEGVLVDCVNFLLIQYVEYMMMHGI